MSQRHRQSRAEAAGYAKVPKEERRLDHRRERQAARTALQVSDPDEVLTPQPVHSGAVKRAEGSTSPSVEPQRRFRHWKARFWKRRTAMRRQRAEALRSVAED